APQKWKSGLRGSPIGQRQSWLSRSSSFFGSLDFFRFRLVMVLPAPLLALPSRAARNRRSGLSGHPPSRGDLLGAPLPGALGAGGSSPRKKLATRVQSGLETSRVFAASSQFQDNRCRQRGPHPPVAAGRPGGQHFHRRIGSLIYAPP